MRKLSRKRSLGHGATGSTRRTRETQIFTSDPSAITEGMKPSQGGLSLRKHKHAKRATRTPARMALRAPPQDARRTLHQLRRCPPLRSSLVSRLMANRPCGSRAGLRVALRGEEESRPTLALAFIPGHVAALTAPLPFACGSDGGCSNHADVHIRVGSFYAQ